MLSYANTSAEPGSGTFRPILQESSRSRGEYEEYIFSRLSPSLLRASSSRSLVEETYAKKLYADISFGTTPMRSSSSIQSDASSWDDELHSPLTPVVPALSLDPSFDIFPSSRPRVDCEPFDYDSLDRRHLIDTVAFFIYETAVSNSPEELESRARNEYTDPVTVMLTSESSRSLCVPPRTIAKHLGQLSRIREISNESLVKMLFLH